MSTRPTASPSVPLALARPPLAVPVSIADRAGRSFAPLACVRGYRYFLRKRVEVTLSSERALDATVKGKRAQRVRLRVDDGRLATACTCCARLLGPAACKHVWATLLEIDHRRLLEGLRSTARAMRLGVIDDAEKIERKRASSTGASAPRRATAGKAPAPVAETAEAPPPPATEHATPRAKATRASVGRGPKARAPGGRATMASKLHEREDAAGEALHRGSHSCRK